MNFYREVTDNMISEAIGTMMSISSRKMLGGTASIDGPGPLLLTRTSPDNDGRSFSETTPSALHSDFVNSDIEFHKNFMKGVKKELLARD